MSCDLVESAIVEDLHVPRWVTVVWQLGLGRVGNGFIGACEGECCRM